MNIRKILVIIAAIAAAVIVAGCGSRAATVSHNLSTEADNFNIARTITFFDTQTGQVEYVVKGLCSVGDSTGQNAPINGDVLTTTCKLGNGKYIKDFLGTNREMTYFVTQNTGASVSDTHYQIIIRPGSLFPGVSVQ